MKSDEDVRVLSSIKLDDFFGDSSLVREGLRNIHRGADLPSLGFHPWLEAKDSPSTSCLIKKSDVSACIYNTEIFDFLIDIIPKEDLKSLKKLPAEGMFNPIPRWFSKSCKFLLHIVEAVVGEEYLLLIFKWWGRVAVWANELEEIFVNDFKRVEFHQPNYFLRWCFDDTSNFGQISLKLMKISWENTTF